MNKITKIVKSLGMALSVLLLLFSLSLFVPDTSSADLTGDANQVLGGTGADALTADGGTSTVNKVLKTILNVLSFVVGFAAILMMIIYSIQITTSGGDSGKIARARNGVFYALIGLALAILAQVIIGFALNEATTAVSGSDASTVTPATGTAQ